MYHAPNAASDELRADPGHQFGTDCAYHVIRLGTAIDNSVR